MQTVPYPLNVGVDYPPVLCKDRMVLHTFNYPVQAWMQADSYFMELYGNAKNPYQEPAMRVFTGMLKPLQGAVVLDVGANLGLHSIKFARAGCKVIALEPTPKIAEMLAHNMVLNEVSNKVTIYQIALNSFSGSESLRDQHDNSGVNSITHSKRTTRRSEYHTVPCYRLDDLSLGKIDGIKIDVEGMEWPILKHGWRLITEQRPVVVAELIETLTKRFGWHPQDMFNAFHSIGYTVFDKKRQVQTKFAYRKGYCDMVFVPTEKL